MRLVPDISLDINSSINRGVWFTMPFTLDIGEADLVRYYYLLTLEDISIIKLYNISETNIIKTNSNDVEIIKANHNNIEIMKANLNDIEIIKNVI